MERDCCWLLGISVSYLNHFLSKKPQLLAIEQIWSLFLLCGIGDVFRTLVDSLVTRDLEMLYRVVLVVAVGMGEGMGGMLRSGVRSGMRYTVQC